MSADRPRVRLARRWVDGEEKTRRWRSRNGKKMNVGGMINRLEHIAAIYTRKIGRLLSESTAGF
jgi:hypothetical protein